MKSIIQDKRECKVCKTTLNLHKHHIFYGTANRKKSEETGCWCYLCAKHHNMSDEGVHFNKSLDNKLKIEAQKKFEEIHGQEEFMKTFHKSYLKEW